MCVTFSCSVVFLIIRGARLANRIFRAFGLEISYLVLVFPARLSVGLVPSKCPFQYISDSLSCSVSLFCFPGNLRLFCLDV